MRAIDGDRIVKILNECIDKILAIQGNLEMADNPKLSVELQVYKDMLEEINEMPTIEPERPKGKWVDSWRSKLDGTRYWYRECDHCGYERNDCDPEKDSNFCPNCGASLEGE